jgi:hypothetical protein
VPVHSSLFLGDIHGAQYVELAAMLSVRNVCDVHPITLDVVRYDDSTGKQLREYLDKPSTLPPMGSVEFVVQRKDKSGGPGANFMVRWHADVGVDEPLAEAVMIGRNGDQGITFTSRGRALTIPSAR